MSESRDAKPKDITPSPEDGGELTPQKAWTLLFNSFRFSQGGTGVQELIFYWLHTRYPDIRLSESVYEELLKMRDRVKRYVDKPELHVPRDPVLTRGIWAGEAKEMRDILNGTKTLDGFYEGFKSKSRSTADQLMDDLVLNVIDRDGDNLILKGGRPRKAAEGNNVSPDQDPFLSHLCYYGFEGQAQTEEYRRFWREVVDHMKKQAAQNQLSSVMVKNIRSIVKLYEEKHPGKKIDLSFLEAQ